MLGRIRTDTVMVILVNGFVALSRGMNRFDWVLKFPTKRIPFD